MEHNMDDLNNFTASIRSNGVFSGIQVMRQRQSGDINNDLGVDLNGLEYMTANIQNENRDEMPQVILEEVDKDFIPMIPDRRIREWTIEKYNLQEATEDVIAGKVQDVKDEKALVRKIARDYVHCFLVEALKTKGVNSVRSMNDIKDYWKTNKDSEEGIATMKYVMYGYFDERLHWDNIVEQKILSILGKRYRDSDSKTKGCVARILTEEKNEKVKQIQKQVKNEIRLGIRRENGITEEEKRKRRKKGSVYVHVSINNSQIMSHNNSATNDLNERLRNAVRSISGIGENEIEEILRNFSNGTVEL